jgi:hypothetical protein
MNWLSRGLNQDLKYYQIPDKTSNPESKAMALGVAVGNEP